MWSVLSIFYSWIFRETQQYQLVQTVIQQRHEVIYKVFLTCLPQWPTNVWILMREVMANFDFVY